LGVAAAALLVLAVMAPWSTASADDGQLIEIGGGRRMYLECQGTGGPTVVFESGWPNDGTVWQHGGVFQAVSGFTRACVYDRPGTATGDHLSRSDAALQPRTAADVVADLHALLHNSSEPGPYVFVAHSIGGLFTRLYSTTYPDDVAGLVLVDTSHEDQANELRPILPPELVDPILYGSEHPAPDVVAAYPQVEQILFDQSGDQVRDAQASSPLRPMPMVVLTHGVPLSVENQVPPNFPGAQVEATLAKLQRRLAHLVPGARQIIAAHSGHYIQLTEPNLVIDATRAVVDAVRRGETHVVATELPQTGARPLVIASVASALLAVGVALRRLTGRPVSA
jgi:pimeloyl-ACP methyl ester carboxylesterase